MLLSFQSLVYRDHPRRNTVNTARARFFKDLLAREKSPRQTIEDTGKMIQSFLNTFRNGLFAVFCFTFKQRYLQCKDKNVQEITNKSKNRTTTVGHE